MPNVLNTSRMRFLKQLRIERGYDSATKFAIMLGLSPQTYALYEKSGKRINLAILAQIRRKLNLSWSELGKLIDQEVEHQKKD